MQVVMTEGDEELRAPEVWVLKWVDYSSKDGLGYLLSNGATGVFFNDATKITLEPLCSRFCYIERKAVIPSTGGGGEQPLKSPSKASSSGGVEKVDAASFWTIRDYPPELEKKVTLLQHFRGYLDGSGEGEIGVCSSGSTCTLN